ncbi:virginiamycin B lyase, partial [Mycobacterium sp. ITM-2017-0098]
GELEIHPVHPQSKPSIIVKAPDGAMWFTRNGDDRIGRIATDGAQRDIELPHGSAPFGLCVGPDGALWFTTMASGTVSRIGAGD